MAAFEGTEIRQPCKGGWKRNRPQRCPGSPEAMGSAWGVPIAPLEAQ